MFFHFIKILIVQAVSGGKRAKNKPKMKKNNYIHHAPYLRNNVDMIMIFGTPL